MLTNHIVLPFAVLSAFLAFFLIGCDSCRDCIESIKYLDMPQEDGSINCLYFGEFEKFVYRPAYSLMCPDTLYVKREALQNKGLMGLTFINEWLIENGTIFYSLPLCKAEPNPAIAPETSLEKYNCNLLMVQ